MARITSRRSTMPKRTSAADPTPDARRRSSRWTATWRGAAARAQRRCAASCPGCELALHAAAEWGDDEAALARCRADIARGDIVIAHHAVHGGPHPRRPAGAAGAARRLRRHALLHVGRRGGEADPPRPLRHVRRGDGRDRAAQAAARQRAPGGSSSGAGPDDDAAPAAADPALHPGHGPGRARLLPDPAVLARRLGREHRQHGPLPDRSLRRRPARAPARQRCRRARRSSIRRSASTTRADGPDRRTRSSDLPRGGSSPARSACWSCAPTSSPAIPPTTTA